MSQRHSVDPQLECRCHAGAVAGLLWVCRNRLFAFAARRLCHFGRHGRSTFAGV